MGLTLPGFVERSKVIASLPSLGLLTLAGMTPSHHDVHYMEVEDFRDGKSDQDISNDFDLIAISSFSAQIKEAYLLADVIRAKGVPVVMGGLHVTCLPDEANEHCDAVIVGEGELSWPVLLKDAENGRLKPFYGSIDDEFDLKDAPMPAFELLDIKKYNRLTVQTCRGCSHRCEFCASSILLTRQYKQKPAEKVLAEIDKIKEIWEYPFIEFESFTLRIKLPDRWNVGDPTTIKLITRDKNDSYIRQEIFYGSFKRIIQLPEDANQDKLSTKYDSGILEVTISKKKLKTSKAKVIKIH
jgi:radical SAM superfamily enzyme YgiQ (UPF0313 family)